MNCGGKIPAVHILQRLKKKKNKKTRKGLQDGSLGLFFFFFILEPLTDFPEVNEGTGKSFRHFIKIPSHKCSGKAFGPAAVQTPRPVDSSQIAGCIRGHLG